MALAAAEQGRAAFAARHGGERVDRAVMALAEAPPDDPASDRAVAAAAEELRRGVPAQALVVRLSRLARSPDASRRRAAARLLGELRLPQTLPVLLELARDPNTRPAVLPAVARMADEPTLAALARHTPDEADRTYLLAELLGRGSGRATTLYLRALADADAAPAAVQALNRINPADPPPQVVDTLFGHLRHPNAALRLAAAKALGRIDGPVVTARLEAMVRRDDNRRAALAALLASDSPEAARFLRSARRSPALAGAIDAVAAQKGAAI